MKLRARRGAALFLAALLVLPGSASGGAASAVPALRFAVPGRTFEIPVAGAPPGTLDLVSRTGTARLAAASSVTPGALVVSVPPETPPGYYDVVTRTAGSPARVRVLREGGRAMRVAHLTDIHYGEDPALEESLGKAMPLLAEYDPDVVLCSGDIMTDPDADGYDEVRRILDRAPAPVFFARGNHDHEGMELFAGRFSSRPWYSFDAGIFRFVALDTGGTAGRFSRRGKGLGEEQMAWLRQDLARARGRPTVLFLHHSPVVRRRGFPEGPELLGLAAESGVAAILAGHLHRDAVFNAGGGPLVIHTTTLGSSRLSGSHRGLRFLDLGPEGTASSPLPGSVPLDGRAGRPPVDRASP